MICCNITGAVRQPFVGPSRIPQSGATAMRWVRANLQVGAWCALFALAMQFALSFGHVHVPGTGKGSPALLAQMFAPVSASGDVPTKPDKPAKSIAHDQC